MTTVYKVEFAENLGNRTFVTFVYVRAKSKQEAESKVKRTQRRLARGSPFKITIIGTTIIGSREEQILDRLFDIYPGTYYDLWEPDISTRAMIEGLIAKYPDAYNVLKGQ